MTARLQFKDAIRAHTINLLRDLIMEKIHDSALPSSIGEADKGLLKHEYNRLSNELESLKQAPPMDPLARLPPEVWTEIIRETAEENGVNLSPTDALLLLTLVSREWSTKVIGTPVLWTNIIVGRGDADAQAKLASALYFTEHLEFGITIEVPPCQWEDNLCLLRAHTARLKKITFRFSGRGDFHDIGNAAAGAKCIDNLFASLGHLPSLKLLRGPDGSRLSWDGVFENCPNLTHIYGAILPLDASPTQTPVPIRACRVEAPWCDIIPSLEDFSHLEDLEWCPKIGVDVDVSKKYGSLPSLPVLKRILSYNVQSPNMLGFLKLTEKLTWLSFTIQGSRAPPERHGRDISFPADRLTETGIQYLHLSYSAASFARAGGRSAAFTNQETLFSIFPMFFPGVRRLVLFFVSLGPKAAAFIQSATRLSSLSLTDVESSPDYQTDACIISPTLKVLDLRFIARSIIPGPIVEYSTISKLALEVFDDRGEWDGSDIQYNVRHLRIRSSSSHLKITGFRALRKLRVYGWSLGRGDGTNCEILIPFICEPTICPLLTELELDFIPEWDLLFLMLERRNHLPQSLRISRLKTLLLPCPPPPHLLVPLTEILAGRFTVRPPNEDLSTSSFMEVYFDPSIPGCRACLQSLKFCSAPLKQATAYPVGFNNIKLPNKPPTISTETWNWLEGRHNRLLEWERLEGTWTSGGFDRDERCTAMKMAQRPFIITAHKFRGEELATITRSMSITPSQSLRPPIQVNRAHALFGTCDRTTSGKRTSDSKGFSKFRWTDKQGVDRLPCFRHSFSLNRIRANGAGVVFSLGPYHGFPAFPHENRLKVLLGSGGDFQAHTCGLLVHTIYHECRATLATGWPWSQMDMGDLREVPFSSVHSIR